MQATSRKSKRRLSSTISLASLPAGCVAIESATPRLHVSSEIRSGWRLILAALLGTALGLPVLPFYTVGIFAPVWAEEFGWSFAGIFGGLIVTTAVLLLGGPLVGHLIDRRGARTIAAISIAGLGLGYTTLAMLDGSLVHYYVSWALLSLAGIGATSISFTCAINGTFIERRGLALGLALCGIGLFAFAVKPLAGWLIEVAGWRVAISTIGLLPLLIGAPVVLWGLPAKQMTEVRPELSGLTLKEAVRTRAFKIMVCAFIAISFGNGAPIPHLENILRTAHIDARQIVTLTSFIGVALIAGRLAGGWLLDKVWAPALGAAVLAVAATGGWILSQQTITPTEAAVAILLLGFAGGAEVDLLPYLTARYMGVRSYGVVYGTIFGLFSVGAGMGPSVLGLAYDRLGSYSQIMTACVLLLLLAAGLLLSLGRYPADPGAPN
jgi:predicted MFS family arabinose efflux permease